MTLLVCAVFKHMRTHVCLCGSALPCVSVMCARVFLGTLLLKGCGVLSVSQA